MKPLRDMTRAELERCKAKADAVRREVIEEMIAAGRGHERPSETRLKTDALSLRYMESAFVDQDIADECRRRIDFHGNLHKTHRKGTK